MRPDYELADDFDFSHRLLTIGDIARLDKVLTVWHADNTTYGREAALNANAVRVLAAAYAPLLGAEAADAATLVIRHLSDRKPVRDGATLARLGSYLTRLLAAFLSGAGPRRATARRAGDRNRNNLVAHRARRRPVGRTGPAASLSSAQPGLRCRRSGPRRADVTASALVGLTPSRMLCTVGSPYRGGWAATVSGSSSRAIAEPRTRRQTSPPRRRPRNASLPDHSTMMRAYQGDRRATRSPPAAPPAGVAAINWSCDAGRSGRMKPSTA